MLLFFPKMPLFFPPKVFDAQSIFRLDIMAHEKEYGATHNKLQTIPLLHHFSLINEIPLLIHLITKKGALNYTNDEQSDTPRENPKIPASIVPYFHTSVPQKTQLLSNTTPTICFCWLRLTIIIHSTHRMLTRLLLLILLLLLLMMMISSTPIHRSRPKLR